MRYTIRILIVALATVCTASCGGTAAHADDGRPGNLGMVGVGAIILNNQVQRELGGHRQAISRVPNNISPNRADREVVREAQSLLNAIGLPAGPVDGAFGRRTRSALERFQRELGLPSSGRIDLLTLGALNKASDVRKRFPDLPVSGIIARTRRELSINGGQVVPTAGLNANPVVTGSVKPVRLFAHASEYPPAEFRGYGLVVFKSEVSTFDRTRFSILCEAYVSSILHVNDLGRDPGNQFVTIWPLEDPATVAALNQMWGAPGSRVCNRAIDGYDTAVADRAIEAARNAGFDEEGRGPFLLGWLPGKTYGQPDALILQLDLSHVETYQEAQAIFQDWKYDIENDPDLLRAGFSVEKMRRKTRRWADTHGKGIFSVIWGS